MICPKCGGKGQILMEEVRRAVVVHSYWAPCPARVTCDACRRGIRFCCKCGAFLGDRWRICVCGKNNEAHDPQVAGVIICPRCKGTGYREKRFTKCPYCEDGRVPCPECGEGRKEREAER